MSNAKHDPTLVFLQNGQPIVVDALGSLGLLALGYRGLLAWRAKRAELANN